MASVNQQNIFILKTWPTIWNIEISWFLRTKIRSVDVTFIRRWNPTSKACRRGGSYQPKEYCKILSLAAIQSCQSLMTCCELWFSLFLLTFQRILWSSDAFCNIVSANIHLKLCFALKRTVIYVDTAVFWLFEPSCLLSLFNQKPNQLYFASMGIWVGEIFLLKKSS